jgi:hypothetical protein
MDKVQKLSTYNVIYVCVFWNVPYSLVECDKCSGEMCRLHLEDGACWLGSRAAVIAVRSSDPTHRMLCCSSSSQYGTGGLKDAQTTSGQSVFHLRCSSGEKALGADEYVGMVADTLKMGKNICLCRHFHNLDKKLMVARLVTLVCEVSGSIKVLVASSLDSACDFPCLRQ